MTHPVSICTLATLAGIILTGCQVDTDPSGRTVVPTPTLGQALGLTRQTARPSFPHIPVAANGTVQEQRVVAGRIVQIVANGAGHAVLVDGRVLANDTEDDRVTIQGVYQGDGHVYVLIAEQSGGNACPSLYQALDVSGGAALVSPQIGNCSDLPRVSVVEGALRIAVPAFRAAPAKTFVFGDGHLRS